MSKVNDKLENSLAETRHQKNLEKIKLKNEYTQADKIIRYLTSPEDSSIDLTQKEKNKLDILKVIHGYRMRYHRKSDIINIIQKMYDIKERQCWNLIQECEYVFGSLEGVNKAYERNFLLECSRKNIELAMISKKSDLISKALREHYLICGLQDINIELPDFSALEPNQYVISIPKEQENALKQLLTKGYLNMADLVPTQNITFDITAKDVTNE
jgi:hypothetical protein